MQIKSYLDLINSFIHSFTYYSANWTCSFSSVEAGQSWTFLFGLCICLEIVQTFASCEGAVMELLEWQHLIGCSCSEIHPLSMSNC